MSPQSSSTVTMREFILTFSVRSDLIFDVAELVAWCSQGTTLLPGTLM